MRNRRDRPSAFLEDRPARLHRDARAHLGRRRRPADSCHRIQDAASRPASSKSWKRTRRSPRSAQGSRVTDAATCRPGAHAAPTNSARRDIATLEPKYLHQSLRLKRGQLPRFPAPSARPRCHSRLRHVVQRAFRTAHRRTSTTAAIRLRFLRAVRRSSSQSARLPRPTSTNRR